MRAVTVPVKAGATVVRRQGKCVNLGWYINQIWYIWLKICCHHSMFTTFSKLLPPSASFLFFFFTKVRGWNSYIDKPKWNTGSCHSSNPLSFCNVSCNPPVIAYKVNYNLASTYYFSHISLIYQKSTFLYVSWVPLIPNISSDNKQPRISVLSIMKYFFLIHGTIRYLGLSWTEFSWF